MQNENWVHMYSAKRRLTPSTELINTAMLASPNLRILESGQQWSPPKAGGPWTQAAGRYQRRWRNEPWVSWNDLATSHQQPPGSDCGECGQEPWAKNSKYQEDRDIIIITTCSSLLQNKCDLGMLKAFSMLNFGDSLVRIHNLHVKTSDIVRVGDPRAHLSTAGSFSWLVNFYEMLNLEGESQPLLWLLRPLSIAISKVCAYMAGEYCRAESCFTIWPQALGNIWQLSLQA